MIMDTQTIAILINGLFLVGFALFASYMANRQTNNDEKADQSNS
jgi:hypothetical protein